MNSRRNFLLGSLVFGTIIATGKRLLGFPTNSMKENSLLSKSEKYHMWTRTNDTFSKVTDSGIEMVVSKIDECKTLYGDSVYKFKSDNLSPETRQRLDNAGETHFWHVSISKEGFNTAELYPYVSAIEAIGGAEVGMKFFFEINHCKIKGLI